jgi:hypothetical protein
MNLDEKLKTSYEFIHKVYKKKVDFDDYIMNMALFYTEDFTDFNTKDTN